MKNILWLLEYMKKSSQPMTVTMYYILSRASEAGSPTNRPGSDKTRGQGSFGPSTGTHCNLDQAFATNDLIHVKL